MYSGRLGLRGHSDGGVVEEDVPLWLHLYPITPTAEVVVGKDEHVSGVVHAVLAIADSEGLEGLLVEGGVVDILSEYHIDVYLLLERVGEVRIDGEVAAVNAAVVTSANARRIAGEGIGGAGTGTVGVVEEVEGGLAL